MNFPAKVSGLKDLRLPERELHLAIGMFDGVHRGHQRVIQNAIDGARRSGGIAGVLTFWPHPSYLFLPENPVPQIMTPDVKEQVLRSLGVDLIIEQPFDREFAAIPADHFVLHLQSHLPGLRALYVGENWRFGKGRTGDAAFLAGLGRAAGVEVISAPRLQFEGSPVSSTRIRDCLRRGEMAAANALLGYTYFSEGIVREGKRLGRTLGFPTLNLPWAPLLKPRFGVYAVRVAGVSRGDGGGGLPGVANYGLRPTVEESGQTEPRLEVFLLGDQCPFSTGDEIRVDWLDFLRPEKTFPSLDALKEQITRDVEQAKKFFEAEA